jgi:hypothetical protein
MAAHPSIVDLATYRRARAERVADVAAAQAAAPGFALVWVPVWYPVVAMPLVEQQLLASRGADDRPAG